MDFLRVMAAGGGVCGVVALGLVLVRGGDDAPRGRGRAVAEAGVAEAGAAEGARAEAGGAGDAARVAQLESSVATLAARVETLERAARARAGMLGGAGAGSGEGTGGTGDDGSGRVRPGALADSDAPLGDDDALASPAVRERLKGVMREMQDEVFAERMKQRQQERETQRAARIDKFVSEARLSPAVEGDLRAAFDAERDRARKVFDEVRSGGKTFPDAFGEMRKVRESTDVLAKNQLDEAQRALYDKMRQEDEASRRPPFFGGPPGGADGGAGAMPMPPPPLPW